MNDLSSGLIILAPTNRRTYQVNHKKLNSIDSPEFSYLGKVTGSFKLSDMMSEKNLKLKVQAKIQGNELRISGPKRDVLQEVIQKIKDLKLDIPLQFINFRD